MGCQTCNKTGVSNLHIQYYILLQKDKPYMLIIHSGGNSEVESKQCTVIRKNNNISNIYILCLIIQSVYDLTFCICLNDKVQIGNTSMVWIKNKNWRKELEELFTNQANAESYLMLLVKQHNGVIVQRASICH